MRINLSLSDVPIGSNEQPLVQFFKSAGCTVVKEPYNAKANVYKCTGWSLSLLKLAMTKLDWEANDTLFPDKAGNYHLVHEQTDEICVVSPNQKTFVLEFVKA
jgi:hypothetical protein